MFFRLNFGMLFPNSHIDEDKRTIILLTNEIRLPLFFLNTYVQAKKIPCQQPNIKFLSLTLNVKFV